MEGALFATTPASNKVNFAALEFFSYFLCKFPTSISVRRPRCYYLMPHNCRVNAFDDQSTVNEFSLFILHLQKLAKITAFMTSLPRFISLHPVPFWWRSSAQYQANYSSFTLYFSVRRNFAEQKPSIKLIWSSIWKTIWTMLLRKMAIVRIESEIQRRTITMGIHLLWTWTVGMGAQSDIKFIPFIALSNLNVCFPHILYKI